MRIRIMTDEVVEQVIELMKDGMTGRQALDKLSLGNVSVQTIQHCIARYRKEHGINERFKPGRKCKAEWRPVVPEFLDTGKIGALRRAGWSLEDIADDMHTTPEYVVQAMEGCKTGSC